VFFCLPPKEGNDLDVLSTRDEAHLASAVCGAMESERQRLARDIHDGPAQLLTNLTMRLEVVKEMVKHSPQTVLPEISRIQEMLRTSVGELRRMIYDLRPVVLEERGLVGIVTDYVERCQYLTSVPISLRAQDVGSLLDETVAIVLFRMIQECVTNSLKHARPTRVDVVISVGEGVVQVVVSDNGIGFQAPLREAQGQPVDVAKSAQAPSGFGRPGLLERARILGGEVRYESSAGQGTTVFIKVPLSLHRDKP